MPKFHVKVEQSRRRILFEKVHTPNWWQLGKWIKDSCLESVEAQRLARALSATAPFSVSIDKEISIHQKGTSTSDSSAREIALEFLTSYLFAAGTERWNAAAFEKVWNDCLAYFDPTQTTLKYALYAPIFNLMGIEGDSALTASMRSFGYRPIRSRTSPP
jgi:hypothetical protein